MEIGLHAKTFIKGGIQLRTTVPINNASSDYNGLLDSFISLIKLKQAANVRSIFLTGSYARGDATDASDLDVWCIFEHIDNEVLNDVGASARELPISYNQLEVNAQCMSIEELKSKYFINWTERSVKILDGVLIFGEDLFGSDILTSELNLIYKKYLADVLMSIRHYICVDEPAEKLTYKKLKTYILKPLMFPLRLERYCAIGYYPHSNYDLLKSYDNSKFTVLVEYFINQEKFDLDIGSNHKKLLFKLHDLVLELLNYYNKD